MVHQQGKCVAFGRIDKDWRRSAAMFFVEVPEPHEHFIPDTVFIPNNLKGWSRFNWLKEQMTYNDEEFMLDVCSYLSHEWLHIALSNIGLKADGDRRFDDMFGTSFMDSYKDIHGLMNFRKVFKPRKHKIRWSGKKGL